MRLTGATRALAARRSFVACLAGAWLLTAATHYYVIAPASTLSAAADGLGVSPGRAVWLVSAVPAAWAVTNVAVGGPIDRFGDYRVIAAGTAVVVLAGVASWRVGRAGAFRPLLAARLVAGVGIGAIWTASTNLIGGAVSGGNRGTAVGVFVTSAPAGFAVGQFAAPAVAARAGWHGNFLAATAAALVAFVVLTGGIRGLTVAATPPTASMRANLATVARRPAVRYAAGMAFAAYSYYLFVNSWMPSYLGSEFALSPELSGLLTAAFPAMGLLSRAGGGVVSDRLLGRRRIPVLRAAFLVSLPLVAVLAWTRRLAVVVASLVVAGFVIQLTFGVVYSYVREVVDEDVTGTALGLLTTAGIAGAFSAPLIAGALIGDVAAYGRAFGYAAAVTALGLGLSWIAPESADPSLPDGDDGTREDDGGGGA